jgi:Sulfatase
MKKPSRVPNDDKRRTGFAILALVAAGCWPFANFINENRAAYFNLHWALLYAAIVVAFALAVTAVLSAVTRKPFFRIAAPVAVYVVLLFSYGAIRQLWPSNSKPEFVFLGWSGLVLLGCALAWFASRHPTARGGIFAGLLVLFALPAVGLVKYRYSGAVAASADRMEFLHSIAFRQKPNVYFMILDAYGRADTLKLALGFDNKGFLGELERLGFFIPRHSVSNYPATNASVGSMLSLDYPEAAKTLDPDVSSFRRELRGTNPVVEKFKAEGYRYILMPAGIWTKIDCGGEEDLCLEKTRPLEMERALTSLTPIPVLQLLPHGSPFSGWLAPAPGDYLEPNDVFGLFGGQMRALQRPFFMMVHFAGIHDGIYNEDCSKGTPASPVLYDSDSISRYTASVNCTNRQVLDLATRIVAEDPDAIILLTGDHGPYVKPPGVPVQPGEAVRPFTWGANTPENYRNMFGTMTALRFPASCNGLLSDHHYAVNNFRVVFACLGNTEIKLLEDRAYYFYHYDRHVEPVRGDLLE